VHDASASTTETVLELKKTNAPPKACGFPPGMIFEPGRLIERGNVVQRKQRLHPMIEAASFHGRLGMCIHVTAASAVCFCGSWTLETLSPPQSRLSLRHVCQVFSTRFARNTSLTKQRKKYRRKRGGSGESAL